MSTDIERKPETHRATCADCAWTRSQVFEADVIKHAEADFHTVFVVRERVLIYRPRLDRAGTPLSDVT